MACSGVRNDGRNISGNLVVTSENQICLCEELGNLSLNSSHSNDRTEPKSAIEIEKNLRKILEIFNNESSKDIKPLDVAKSTGIGSNKKAVNSLLHFLKNKKILTLKTGEKGADPRWSRDPSNNTYTEKNLQEWANAIELVNKSRPGSEAISAPGQPRNIKAKVLSPKRIEVSWLPPTDSANIRSYNVYFSNSSENQKLQRVMEHPNSYVLEDLIPDTVYHFQVSATTNGGEGEKSPIIEVKTSPLVPIIELKGHTFNVDEGKSVAIECNIIYEKKYRSFWERINEDDETNILTIKKGNMDKYLGLESDPPFLRILNSAMSDRGYYRCCIEYSTSNGEETVRSKKAHLNVEKAVKPGDTYIEQQVNIKANKISADTINMGGDETKITVKNTSEKKKEKMNTSRGSSSSSSSSSENEMSENFDEINSVCGHEPGDEACICNRTELQPSKQ